MTRFTDVWVIPWLALLADWSVRCGVLFVILTIWFALRPPRRASTRYLLCVAALVAGLLVPLAPRWGNLTVPWDVPGARIAADHAEPPAATRAPHDSAPMRVNERQALESPTVRPPAVAPAATAHSESILLGPWRLASLALASAWAFGVLVLLIRLAGGWLMLARLCRGAVDLECKSDMLFSESRTALGLSRPVRLAWHPTIASPVVFGCFPPCILVPPEWGDWPSEHRRACLLHELAHLARRDDWAKLAQELISAVFFFHPLVRWLLARLDRERELLCDEAVVALGTEPAGYARMLLDLAKRPSRILSLSATAELRPALLPFLDRRTVAIRISRLLEDDLLNTLSRRSLRRSLILGSAAVAVALGVMGIRVRAVEPQAKHETKAPATADSNPPSASSRKIEGVILDSDGKPVAGATVVAGLDERGKPNHQVFETDKDGRFNWSIPERPVLIYFVAYKKGLSPAIWMRWMDSSLRGDHVERKLEQPKPFAAVLVDRTGKPVAGATVRIEMTVHSWEIKNGQTTQSGQSFEYVRDDVVAGSPLESLFKTTTDANGLFVFSAVGPKSGLKLAVTAADGRRFSVRAKTRAIERLAQQVDDEGFVSVDADGKTRVVAEPTARIAGRVFTKLPRLTITGLKASYQASHEPGIYRPMRNLSDQSVPIDAEGRFTMDGLSEGTVNVFVDGDGENRDWTYRAAELVRLTSGTTTDVTIELIRGVEVEGTIVASGTGTPLPGAEAGVHGPLRPRSSASSTGVKTDATGRFRRRLPPGETYFYVMSPPPGFTRLSGEGSSRTVTIPDGTLKFEVSPIELAPAVTLRGHVLDSTDKPIEGAQVVGICENGLCRPFPGQETLTDARGEFQLPPGMYNTVAVGKPARLLIRLRDGAEHEATATPAADGAVNVKLPTGGDRIKGVEGPRAVAPDELAGVVVDIDGKPIEGALVDAWTWVPGHEAKTDAHGFFSIGKLDKGDKVEVVVRKPGYTPQLFLSQPAGAPGWVIVLGNKTFFEGRVTGPDDKPVAGALIRANSGPKRADGGIITDIWTEARTGGDGRYRMYAQSDTYDIQVRVEGVGVTRMPNTSIGPDEAKRLDIRLVPGVTFWAKVVDSLTGDRIPNVRLWHWQHPGVEGRPNKDGYVAVRDMFPGRFSFQVDAPGYARWWSDQSASEGGRRLVTESGWQSNFGEIDFDLESGMRPVTISLEPAATVTGRVLDPDGKPVAGATVAPARTGTFNSLTGDTRFSFESSRDGTFTMLLPASGGRDYNLIAHDGKYGQWRKWANGVLPPMRTKPGETLRDVELRLTRPATVRGRVADAAGRPVAGREVRASAADRLENRYYDPTTITGNDGSYELKFVRAGEQFIQVAPIMFNAERGPQGTNRLLTLTEGESKDGVDFRLKDAGGTR